MSAPDINEASDYGDPVDWSDDEAAEIEVTSEPMEGYYKDCKYYPVRVGEVLDGRYRIVHKLGHGGFSTVWMAHDLQKEKSVALKILVSGKDGETEFLAQHKVKQVLRSAPYIVTFCETFQVPGAGEDQHHVLVMRLLGPNLDIPFRKPSIVDRMSAARQLLVALKAIHDAGIVHRDLNRGAVMWETIQIDKYDKAAQYQHLGRPQKLDITEKTWRPSDLVPPLTIPSEFIGNQVYLGDFGLAISAGTSVDYKPQTPVEFCAPERYHDQNPSLASDMWSYMCIFASLYLGFSVFYGPGGDRIMSLWVDTLGPFPLSWKGHYRYGNNQGEDAWYDQLRKPRDDISLKSKLARRKPVPGEKEFNLVLSLFQKGFCYDPKQRITAAELLEDESFNELLRVYGC